MDLVKLRHEAQFAVGSPDPQTAYLARALLAILDEPSLATPPGCILIRKPELFGKGVNDRRGYV